MIPRHLFPLRNALFKFFGFCAGLLLFYGLLIGATSVWVGFSHRHQQGFWAPALAGTLLIVLIVWGFLRLLLAMKRVLRRSDILYP
jgi:cytochrome c biogenesis protein CcdA